MTECHRPEDHFTKKSRKRYERLRAITRSLSAPEGYVLIPGRQRSVSGPSDTVYLALRRYDIRTAKHVKFSEKRFYFVSKPQRREVRQIVKMMHENMEAKR